MALPRKPAKRLAAIISGQMRRLHWAEDLCAEDAVLAATERVLKEKVYDPGHPVRLCRIVGYILWKAKIVK